ncbi:Porphobilinogen deaminase [Rubripirellula lacrimiformis]|uniref:Porphobilinogen deaminase n=1 Tax=Rubripirellula lacrimiformis TaxID=1930273 RepID=A0A517NEJ2_9BACT|nr:hydroxymethylbilane synthase [Rubripirellula lacrimiformis]QDT05554.1 Porphobilinogen deaminase [Rubripirellula lacrimiformis]
MKLRIATRQSPLALWQAEHVAARLADAGFESVLVPMVSSGDTDMRPIDGTRQVGLFTKRIQQALLDDEADVAVHSLKDLPTEVNEQLALAAVPPRETVADCLVSKSGMTLSDVPQGGRVGTGSRRRAAQLLSRRPDLRVESIRGNVQTRLSKLDVAEEGADGPFDAIVLADAGLVRLKMQDLPRYHFTFDEMLPAPGQGALGIEVRSADAESHAAIATLDDIETRASVTAERTLLASLHGGCLAPIAAYANVAGGKLRLSAVALSPDGKNRIDESAEIDFESDLAAAIELATKVSDKMIAAGAIEMVRG